MNVELRRLEFGDLDRAFKWRNDRDIYMWCRQNDVLHFSNHVKWFEKQSSDPTLSMYMILNETTHPVGVCGLTSIDLLNRRAEFSILIGRDNQEMGYGESAMRQLLRKAFCDYGLNHVFGEVYDKNPGLKMLRRVGFKEDGKRRQFYFRDGKFIDVIMVSILKGEYGCLK